MEIDRLKSVPRCSAGLVATKRVVILSARTEDSRRSEESLFDLRPRKNKEGFFASLRMTKRTTFSAAPKTYATLMRLPSPPRRPRPALPLLLQPLQKPNGRSQKIKTLAQQILQKPFVAEMQTLGLIGEQNKRGRRCGRLRDVVNLHPPRRRRSPAIQIHLRHPAIQLSGRNAPPPRFGHAIDQSE